MLKFIKTNTVAGSVAHRSHIRALPEAKPSAVHDGRGRPATGRFLQTEVG